MGSVKNFKVLLGGREGVTKRSTLCTVLIMLTIMDDPLNLSVAVSKLQVAILARSSREMSQTVRFE